MSSLPERANCRACCEDPHPEGPPLPAPLEVWVQVCKLLPSFHVTKGHVLCLGLPEANADDPNMPEFIDGIATAGV